MGGRSGSSLLFAVLLACTGGPAAPPAPADLVPVPPARKPDVVLVTLDTTRADRLGAYGYAQARTDSIDALAARGLRFDRAYSPLPLTIPSHATMFTGLYPHRHHVRANGDNLLGREFTTLAELLQGQGWNTGASVAAFVTGRQWGFAQGFNAFFDELPEKEGTDKNFWHDERDGQLVVDDALNWLAGQPAEKPVFLWVHLYDAHFPYLPREVYGDTFKDRPYDGELAWVDDQVGRLVSAFEGREVLWALIGDHGESLGDHGELTHGLYTYDATQRVPFILSGAGVKAGVVHEPVSTADLMPTLLRALGLAIPEGLDGKPQPGSPQAPYAESWQLSERLRIAPHRAVVSGNHKLIATPRPELYDLVADPGEKADLAAQLPEKVAELQKLLEATGATPPGKPTAELDADTISQLAALGYVAGGGLEGVDLAALPDPKDHAGLITRLGRLEFIGRSQGPDAALAVLDELIAKKPDAFELRMRKIPYLAQSGRRAEVPAFIEATAKLFPDQPRVWVMLAGLEIREGRLEPGMALAEKALALDPTEAAAQEIVVECLFRLKAGDDAEKRAITFLQANPRSFGVAALLGRYYFGKRDYRKSEPLLRLALEAPSPRRGARGQLALMAIAAGARQDAYKLLEAEVKDYPGHAPPRRMLARLYGEDQKWLEQKEHLVVLARLQAKEPLLQLALAQCYFNLADYPSARSTLDPALAQAPEDPDVLLLHANLLAKEGKAEEGRVVFEKAKSLQDQRVAEARKKGLKIIDRTGGLGPEGGTDAATRAGAAAAGAAPKGGE